MVPFFILRGIFERGLIFSLLPVSMHITSRIIRFDDLTLEGAFGIGGGVAAVLLTKGYSLFISFLCAAIIGGLAGAVTVLLHTRFSLNQLIAGIITSTALFSITLKIAGVHISLPARESIFDSPVWMGILIFVIFVAVALFLRTEVGFLLYAVGDNQKVVVGLSKYPERYQIIGLVLGNMLVGLSGALFTYYLGYFSIWSNVGMLVIALASLILAESISEKFNINLLIGSFLYQAIIALTYALHIDQDWNKLITASIVVICIIFQKIFKR